MRVLVVLLLVLVGGCAAKYQRGVDYERRDIGNVIGADALWWTAQQTCQLRVFVNDYKTVRQITVDRVDPSLCGRR